MGDVFQSFESQQTLNPDIWINAESNDFSVIKLFPDIRKRLLGITDLFMESIKIQNISVEDIIFTGSLANYNWSDYSDVDLHIIVDKKTIKVNPEVLDDYFTAKKQLFNEKHQIQIKNFEVELYVQDVNEQTIALGMYSILTNQWIKTPAKGSVVIDKNNIKKKIKVFIEEINKIDQMISTEEPPNETIALINDLKEKIKKYRKSGLAQGGEYSDENLVFKYLRRTNYLKRLSDYKVQVIDKMFSLQEMN
jgi:hypothetical protein